MLKNLDKIVSVKVLFWTVLTVNLAILPSVSLDPINSPKLFFLGIGGVASFALLLKSLKSNLTHLKSSHFLLAIALIASISFSLLAGGRFEDQFFGVFGRNTGFLALISLVIIFLLATTISGPYLIDKLKLAMFISGSLALVYGLMQVFDADPVDWQPSGYTDIFGFLGNPNFQSAYLGMFGSLLSAYFIDRETRNRNRVLALIGLLCIVFVIIKSESEQGLLVLISGVLVCVLSWMIKMRKKATFFSTLAASSIAFLMTLLGLLNKGPLAPLLYKDSIQFRGDYWRAAWNLGLDNPFFGVGIDRYGENYRLYRDQIATSRRGPDVTSNSPHNVFLDFLTNSGFLGFALYISLNAITLIAVYRYMRRTESFSVGFIGLFAAWIAYVAQSLISVNQLGLAVWGWVLMGALIGFVSTSDLVVPAGINSKKHHQTSRELPSAGIVLTTYIAIGVGVLISILPIYRDIKVVSALKTGDALKIENEAYARPLQASVMFQIASILTSNNLHEASLRVTRAATKSFPDTYEIWRLLTMIPGATEVEKSQAILRMKELDPLNDSI
jgi:O-antigen ligase